MGTHGIPQDEISMFQYDVWLDEFIDHLIGIDPDEVLSLPPQEALDELYIAYPLQARQAVDDYYSDPSAW